MPTVTTDDGVTLYYESEGDGETVAFVGEAGYGAWQWGWQHDRVAGPHEALVWDLRGTGRSGAPAGPYTVDRLADDLERVLAATGTRRVHLVGAGLGGMITLRYARQYDRAVTASLFSTAPAGAAVDWSALQDLHPSSDEEMQESLRAAFSASFLESQPDIVEQICEWRHTEDADTDGFEAQAGAIREFDAGPLYELTLPALVCQGVDDPVVPFEAGKRLAKKLPRATFESVEGRHLCFIEYARPVTDRLLDFLEAHTEETRY